MVSEAGLAVRVSLLAASLPLPMVFPWRWGHGVRLYLLGWFAILEVLVLKSRVSPFLLVSSLLAWCLEFWVPVPVAPLPRGALWFFSSLCGVRVLHRTSGLVRQSLCSLSTCLWPGLCGFGVIHVWVFSGSPSAVRVLCPLLRRVDVARPDLPCSSVGGLHCPGPVNARQIAWEYVFKPGVAVSIPVLLRGAASFVGACRSVLSQVLTL